MKERAPCGRGLTFIDRTSLAGWLLTKTLRLAVPRRWNAKIARPLSQPDRSRGRS